MHYSLPFPLIMQHLKTVGFLRHFKKSKSFCDWLLKVSVPKNTVKDCFLRFHHNLVVL